MSSPPPLPKRLSLLLVPLRVSGPLVPSLSSAKATPLATTNTTAHVTATAATNFVSAFIRLLSLWAGTLTLENPALAVCLSLTVVYAQLLHNLHRLAVALARAVYPLREVGRARRFDGGENRRTALGPTPLGG